jgi:hypothetical protein
MNLENQTGGILIGTPSGRPEFKSGWKAGVQIRRQIGKKLVGGPSGRSGRAEQKTLGVHFLKIVDTKRFLFLVKL